MGELFSFIPKILGTILSFIYNTIACQNYGSAIILFTIFIRICMFPLTMKQLKSTTLTQELQPKIKELQKKYANDKEKLAKEQMALYKEAGTSPVAGCLPLLIQLPILFSLYYVINSPMTYQLNYTPEYIDSVIQDYTQIQYVVNEGLINMNFLNLNLGKIPDFANLFSPYTIFPVLNGVLAFLSLKVSQLKMAKKTEAGEDPDPGAQMTKSMNYVMPLISVMFGFQLPAALSLYWITGYVIQIVQQFLVNGKLLTKQNSAAVNIVESTGKEIGFEDAADNNKVTGTKTFRREQHKKYGKKKN